MIISVICGNHISDATAGANVWTRSETHSRRLGNHKSGDDTVKMEVGKDELGADGAMETVALDAKCTPLGGLLCTL